MKGRRFGAAILVIGLGSSLASAGDRGGPASRVAVTGGGARLAAAVRDARAVALDRLGEHAACRDLFEHRGGDGSRLLAEAVYRSAVPDEAGGLCERGAAAFTGMRSGRTALCRDNFLKLDRYYGAVVLLHEALHVVGLEQAPHHPHGQTPREIDRMVRRSCGL
jgi:hypothetical protein